MNRSQYPENWEQMAHDVKSAADWTCQKCGKRCRRPGEPHETHRLTLTTAHLDHDPENPKARLRAWCAPCHLSYDRQTKRAEAACRKLAKALFGDEVVVELFGSPGMWGARFQGRGVGGSAFWHDTHLDALEALLRQLKRHEREAQGAKAAAKMLDESEAGDEEAPE